MNAHSSVSRNERVAIEGRLLLAKVERFHIGESASGPPPRSQVMDFQQLMEPHSKRAGVASWSTPRRARPVSISIRSRGAMKITHWARCRTPTLSAKPGHHRSVSSASCRHARIDSVGCTPRGLRCRHPTGRRTRSGSLRSPFNVSHRGLSSPVVHPTFRYLLEGAGTP